jgi:hypothetical protein
MSKILLNQIKKFICENVKHEFMSVNEILKNEENIMRLRFGRPNITELFRKIF